MIRYLLPLLFIACQPASAPAQPMPSTDLLYDAHAKCRETQLDSRRFKHSDISALINALPENFRVQTVGESVEGRDIYTVTLGNGPVKVLLWSQMHGDEATATAAIFDIFRFFQQTNDGFDELRSTLLRELTLVFIPMLNPDGAEAFTRRNALGVDLNRDALRLTMPESRILKQVRDGLKADWGFNLHDQNIYYGAEAPKMATLSFLSPAYNVAKDVNPSRLRAMQLIALLNEGLQKRIPGQIARYDDAFEPRAFGDNMQLWGTSTILIESGGATDDTEKQSIRQHNFVLLLQSFAAIAQNSFKRYSRDAYERIPLNVSGQYHDLVLRELDYAHAGNHYTLDIAFNLSEHSYGDNRRFYNRSAIADLGDLSTKNAYTDAQLKGHTVHIADVYPRTFTSMRELQQINAQDLYSGGYAVVMVQKPGPPWERNAFPFMVIGAEGFYDKELLPGQNPPLIIRNADGQVTHAVVNGRLYPRL